MGKIMYQDNAKADKSKIYKKDIVKRLKKLGATLKKNGMYKDETILEDIIREIETKL